MHFRPLKQSHPSLQKEGLGEVISGLCTHAALCDLIVRCFVHPPTPEKRASGAKGI